MPRRPLPLTVCLLTALVVVAGSSAQVNAISQPESPQVRLIDGTPAKATDAPYAAYVDLNRGRGACTGALIAPQWVITAAHCNTGTMAVNIGHLEYAKAKTYDVVARKESDTADLLLLKLDQPVKDVTPVPLGTADPALGVSMTVVGWGKTAIGGPTSPVLRIATMVIAKPRPEKPGGRVPDPADAKGGDALVSDPGTGWVWQGDSGGPAVVDGKLVGVASTASEFSRQAWHSSIKANTAWITKVIKP